jgi:hypothetical protein
MGRVVGIGEEAGGVVGRGEGEKRGMLERISAVISCEEEGTNASSYALLRFAGGFDFIFVSIFVIGPIFTGVAIFVTGGVEDPIFIIASISSSRSEVGLRPNAVPIWNLAIGAMR